MMKNTVTVSSINQTIANSVDLIVQRLKKLSTVVLENQPVVSRISNNTWRVFGYYQIVKQDTGYNVTRDFSFVQVFSTFQNALAWCVLDQAEKVSEASSLLTLDSRAANIDQNLQIALATYKKSTDAVQKQVLRARISDDQKQLAYVKQQIVKQVTLAKYLQTTAQHTV